MMKPVFLKKLLAVAAGTLMMVALVLPGALCQETGAGEAGHRNQQGLEYYKKGFYEHAPKHQAVEAERNYQLAVKEFKAAIARDASSAEAHRNLARVYYVQKNYDGAVEEYRTVTELAPSDLDAYVNLALAFIELKQPDAAIQALEQAKGQTSDPQALETLDSYLAKVRAYQGKEAR